MKWNLPNRITLVRICTIPLFMFFLLFPVIETQWVWRVISCALFALISLTDMLDGKIARKRNLVTDLGKFLDPLADKILVFGAMLAMSMRFALDAVPTHLVGWGLTEGAIFAIVFTCVSFLVIFREMAVTSLRLIAAGKAGKVISAAWVGKVKTTFQMGGICVILLEPVLFDLLNVPFHYILSYAALAGIAFMTVYSGIVYFKDYQAFLKEE